MGGTGWIGGRSQCRCPPATLTGPGKMPPSATPGLLWQPGGRAGTCAAVMSTGQPNSDGAAAPTRTGMLPPRQRPNPARRRAPLRPPARRIPLAGAREQDFFSADGRLLVPGMTFGKDLIPQVITRTLAGSRLSPLPPGRHAPAGGGVRLRVRHGVGPCAEAQARNVPRENRSRSAWGDAAPVVRGAGGARSAAWRRPSRAALGAA